MKPSEAQCRFLRMRVGGPQPVGWGQDATANACWRHGWVRMVEGGGYELTDAGRDALAQCPEETPRFTLEQIRLLEETYSRKG